MRLDSFKLNQVIKLKWSSLIYLTLSPVHSEVVPNYYHNIEVWCHLQIILFVVIWKLHNVINA